MNLTKSVIHVKFMCIKIKWVKSMKKYDVFIIDDDVDINNMIRDALTKGGYTCMQAFSGTEGMLVIREYKFRVIILDLMLPGISGEEFISRSKEIASLPIIVLSAKDNIDGKVKCLELGAEDYITKPFDIKEMLARVQVQIRRNSVTDDAGKKVAYRELTLEPDGCTLSVEDEMISLTRQEYRIMELLMSSPKRVFSKQAIYDYAWDEIYEGEDKTVNVHISNIRKKIKEVSEKEYISTVWGIGFKMKE